MRQEPDIHADDPAEEEAERVSRELGEQIENAWRVLREYRSGLRRPPSGEEHA